jgi:hypothetical protein
LGRALGLPLEDPATPPAELSETLSSASAIAETS